MYAPIIIFAFNRLEPLKRCVASLLANSEAAESDLIVYVEYYREARCFQALNGVSEAVTGDSLNCILHELAAVGFDIAPFVCVVFIVDTEILYRLLLPSVRPDLRINVVEFSPCR